MTDKQPKLNINRAIVWSCFVVVVILTGVLVMYSLRRPTSSPYYADHRRLVDVIAALQAMGAYDQATLFTTDWRVRLGPPVSTSDWSVVFREHPEFFRVGNDTSKGGQEYAVLRWRHAYDRNYDPVQKRDLSVKERARLSPKQERSLTRKPLTPAEIQTLLTTAVELHVRALAHVQENRWITPLLFGLLGAILGVLGMALGSSHVAA
jgi:hypothetical protein